MGKDDKKRRFRCHGVCVSNVNSYSIEVLLHFHTAASPNW